MNPMNPQRQGGSLGFPRMGAAVQSPPIMAPGAVPAPAGNTGIVPPAPMPAAAPAVPQNVPVSVVTAGGPAPAPAPTGVMPTNPAAVDPMGHKTERDHTRTFMQSVPGMTDLLKQYFASGGDIHQAKQQARAARHDFAASGQGSIIRDGRNGGTALIDYLRAHLMPPATGGA